MSTLLGYIINSVYNIYNISPETTFFFHNVRFQGTKNNSRQQKFHKQWNVFNCSEVKTHQKFD